MFAKSCACPEASPPDKRAACKVDLQALREAAMLGKNSEKGQGGGQTGLTGLPEPVGEYGRSSRGAPPSVTADRPMVIDDAPSVIDGVQRVTGDAQRVID